MGFRYVWQRPVKLKITAVDGGYIIALRHRDRWINAVHNDQCVFVLYDTLEAARDAAKHLTELRKIQYV